MRPSRFDFPEGFLFGAATAAYQIEGSRFGGCGPCHWDTFAAPPGNVVRAEDGSVACDHYHRWPADLDLLKAANLDGYWVASIATINEPWCVAWLLHFMGAHAPGHRDIRAAARAMHPVLLAHGAAVQRLRGMGQKHLGIVLNFGHTDAASEAPADQVAAVWDGIFNRWFMEAITQKTYPAEVLAGLSSHIPEGWQDDMALIGQQLDWLGVNYTARHTIAAHPGAPWPAIRDVPGALPKTQMGWEIYPAGLEGFLTRIQRAYVGDLPIYETENGMANADLVEDGVVSDGIREDYLFAHLDATRRAIASGANVKGFFYWSLLDNYEWAEGYEKRFGLVHVDFNSLERVPKSSCHALARALARND